MSEFVYKAFRKEEMELQFNPQASVNDQAKWSQERARLSAAARENFPSRLNVPYGPSARQVLDIFPARRPSAPVNLFFHGGYWRGGNKDDNSLIASLLVPAGATAVVVEYDLCPAVAVGDIVRQARSAVVWAYRNIAGFGGDPSRLFVSGMSAGGHLVAMALAHDWEKEGVPGNVIKGAVAISGVYDLMPVLHVSVNAEIRLTPESARDDNPMLHPPRPIAPLALAVGGDESPGWKQMSLDFFRLCKARGVNCEHLEIPGRHHFSISHLLGEPNNPLASALLRQMNL
jgi:arylformamidase